MPGVLPEVLGPINHVALAAKVVDSMGNALSINAFLGALPEVFLFFEAETILDAVLEHLARLLAQRRMLFMVRFCEFFPSGFNKAH